MKYKRIFIFSAVIVAMFCILGMFSRPYPADEFSFHNSVAKQGFIQAQISSYIGWTGRVFNTFMMGFFALFPLDKIYPFMASFNSIVYTLACFSLSLTLFPTLAIGAKISISLLVCALTLCFTQSLHETFYWLPGMPYFWTGTLILLALSLAVRAFRGSRSSFILCIIVLLLNATNLEQGCVFQGIIAFLAMILFMVRGDKKRASMSCVFWLASIVGFCVMYFAPGTAVRTAALNLTSQPSVIAKILRGFVPAFSMGVFNSFQFFAKPSIYAVVFFLSAIAAKIPPADEKLSRSLRVWHILLVVFAIGVLMQFMMGVISGGGLPERGVSLSLWLMYFIWNTMFIFLYRGKLLHSERFRNFCTNFRWIVLILSVLISTNFRECISALYTALNYATEYDARVEMILEQRKEGVTDLRVSMLKTKPELIFSDFDPISERACRSVARYYGAENLRVVPDELLENTEAIKKLMSGDIEPFAELAEKGNIEAMRIMGDYRNVVKNQGRSTANPAEAEKWYTMGAEMGEPRCMKPLSRVLLPKNFTKAVYWLVNYYIATIRL